MDLDLKKLQEIDPLKPQKEMDLSESEGCSPMAPPDEFSPNIQKKFKFDQMHPILQNYMVEHKEFLGEIEDFKNVIQEIKIDRKLTEKTYRGVMKFFKYFDEAFIEHNRHEERVLFPLLRKRMIENGEHSQTKNPITPIDVLETEHIEAMQLGAVIANSFSLAQKLNHEDSINYILHYAMAQSFSLIEALKLHIFREDDIVFNLTMTYFSEEDFKSLE